MDLFDGMHKPPEDDWRDFNGPQKIFTEALEDVVIVRKQDNKLGIGKTPEEIQAMIDAFEWERKSGIQPAERDQVIDDLRLLKLMEMK